MMKKQVITVAALMILLALSSNFGMVAEAQGPIDCYDGCSTGCVQQDQRKMSRCDRKCSIRCGPDAKKERETGV